MTQHYVGTKIVMAWPQEKDGQAGYAVKYEDGYTSWSPKDIFERAYVGMGHVGALPEDLQELRGQIVYNEDRLGKLRYTAEEEPGDLTPKEIEQLRHEVAALESLVSCQRERFDHRVIVNSFDEENNPGFKVLEHPESRGAGFNNNGLQDNS